jgi:hypothetical protein
VAGSLTLTGMAAGLASGQKVIGPSTMTGSSIVGTITDIVLGTGDNTFAVPAGASAVAIFLPAANVAVIKVRTDLNSGDTGLSVNPGGPWLVWPLAAGTTSVTVNAGAGGASVELTFI